MNICITGASGFIGKNLIKYLSQQGYSVHSFIRKNCSVSNRLFLEKYSTLVSDDIKRCLTSTDTVINLAGQIGQYGIQNEQYREANFSFTKKLISCCSSQKIIHISTAGIFGPCCNADESSSPSPQNIYEQTKLESEILIKKYHNYVIVQPGWVLGPYDFHSLPIFKMIKRRISPMIGHGRNKIQPLYVGDLVLAIEKIIHQEVKNEAFILAGEIITFEQFFRIIAKALSQKIFLIKIPPSIAKKIIAAFEMTARIFSSRPIIRREAILFFTEERTYNVAKICNTINLIPTNAQLTIERTIEYYKKNELI